MGTLHTQAKDLAASPFDEGTSSIPAGQLSVEHIDSVIEFFYTVPRSKVLYRVAGELRQISHDGSGTTIDITGWPDRGELHEFQLGHDIPIEVQP